ncbi:MAG: efflux RND transporter permease subunit [Acidobacteria bacterium]|nr:efflux RND transporter permease subunit [Acidobacteriota bacterium]MBV9478504.1 efflux RND transporter permease subunit [Acidobacteriota bacterium]
MIISDAAIKRPVLTVVAMLILVVFGLFALMKLEVDEFPEIDAPVVTVLVPYPGAAPDQVERDVIDPLEEQFTALSGIDKVQSKAVDGFATITAIFVFGKSADQAAQDVRDAMSSIRGQLPTTILDPIIHKYDPNALPIVSLVLSSTRLSTPELTQIADPGITKVLRGINGVAEVRLSGNINREIQINVRPADLAAAGVDISDVVQAVQTQNISTPAGRVTGQFQESSIRFLGRIENPREFANVIVSSRGGKLVRLGDVADIIDGTAEPRSAALLNGAASVGIDITKSPSVSTTHVADQVLASLGTVEKTLPPGVKLDVIRNSGDRVRNSVSNVQEALVEGAVLTVLVVFLFLNSWRSTVITGLALPVSVLAAFIPVLVFGFTLNTMSLLGLSLAIGILIDDAIVVRENIVRHVEMGKDHVQAAHDGTDEIGVAVTATTLSIVAVFVPVAFMPGFAGQWFKPFALTIAAAVLVSLFVSFSLDPMLSAYWPDPHVEAHKRGFITRALDRFNDWFNRMIDRYTRIVAWALDHRWWMVGIIILSFAGAIVLQATIGGSAFVPETDNSELTITVDTAPGSTLDYTREKTEEIARQARKHPEVVYAYSTVGSSDGSGTVDSGSIYLKLKAKKDRTKSQQQIAAELREEIRTIAGADAYLASNGPGGGGKQVQVQVRGDDLTSLNAAATQIENLIRSVPGATDIGLSTKGQRPELVVELDRSLAATLGFTPSDVANALRSGFAGVKAGEWVDPTGRTRDVTVRLAPAARSSAADVENLPLVSRTASTIATFAAGTGGGTGASASPAATSTPTVPVSHLAATTKAFGPTSIDHYNRDKIITVGANVEGRPLSDVLAEVQRRIKTVKLPAGTYITQGGQAESQSEVFGGILSALALAVLLMYFILVVQFGSFLDPIAILISLPLSLIGVVLALIVTRDTLNLMSLIGVMLLMGIVAKNAILLIDFAKWNHEQGKPLREALIEAGRVRLRPILMTTFALIAGMLPVAIGAGEGGDFRAPLGRAVIGGTITSTLLTLLVIPTVYEILDGFRARMSRLMKRIFRRHAPAEVGSH